MHQCLSFLQQNGIFVWRQNSGAVRVGKRFVRFTSIKGVSDIIGLTSDGRFIAVECKRERGGVLSPEQKKFLESVKRNGGIGIVANSLDTLISELKKNNVKLLINFL